MDSRNVLSWPQQRTLFDMADGGDGTRGVRGRSMHGGMYKVWGALVGKGFVTYSTKAGHQITDTGRKIVAEIRARDAQRRKQ